MKPGKEYELLIEKMYRDLEPNAIVKHDDQIYDDRAKITRQIDVSIRYQFAGLEHLIIVQAKDYKHSASIKVVDEFRTVIADVNANKGILICSKGFTKSAITKAKSYGIECLTVHSALKKHWETLLKIPVRQVIHDFDFEQDFILNIAHKAGQVVKLLRNTFSYDGQNIIDISDIILDNIINKMGWSYIKRSPSISIDLKKLGLYHSFGNEMLQVESGHIKIKYLRTKVKRFYITPTNYLYSTNHIIGQNKLHNLTITKEVLDNILYSENAHDNQLNDDPIIDVTSYNFNKINFSTFSFSVPGVIDGKFYIKNNSIMDIDETSTDRVNLENFLKTNVN